MEIRTRTAHVLALDPGIVAFAGGALGFFIGLLQAAFSLAFGGVAKLGEALVSLPLQSFFGLVGGGLFALVLNFVLRRVGGLRVELAAEP